MRPTAGETRYHDRYGEVLILSWWGPRSCKVFVKATETPAVLFDENLHREAKP